MLDQMLAETVRNDPKAQAFVYGDLRVSYQQLYTKVVGLSRGLSSIGIKQSDCIALLLPNCPEFIITFYAAAKLNAIVLPLNPLLKEDEVKYYISDSNVSAIVTDIKRADICRNIISQLDRKIELIVINAPHTPNLDFHSLIQEHTGKYEAAIPYEGDVLYQYSSGSTGRPKRVCRTQKNLFHEASNFTATTNLTTADNILVIVPLFHAHGLGNCLLAATCAGANLVFLEEAQSGSAEVPFIFRCPRVLELIQTEKITILPGVPYIFKSLAETPFKIQVDLSNVRLCFSAGNFLPKDTFDKFAQKFGIPIKQLYGSTEAGSVSINLENEPEICSSVGLSMKNVEVKIVNESSEVARGLIGEIAIASQALTSGYDKMPDLNREVFRNGYFFTGDLGKQDEEGRLYITGRKRIFIDTGGYKVDPLEIEDIISAHPKVKEAVVVGTKGPYAGEIVKAVVVLKGECKEQEILSHCRDRLAGFKVPKIVEFRAEIPKSPLGKVLRKNLI